MGKLFGLILILGAIYFGMQRVNERSGEALKPIESTSRDSSAFGGHLIGDDVSMPTERDKSHVTQNVRDRVGSR